MKPTPITYNNTSLQSSDYQAYWPEVHMMQGNVSALYTQRAGAWPFLSGKTFSENQITLSIICKHDFTDLFESLNALFDVQDETPRQLIVRDDSDASTDNEYFIYALPVSPIGIDGNEYSITLALETPIWQSVTEFSQTFSTSSSTGSTDFPILGNCEAYPKFEVTPGSASTADYTFNEYVLALPVSTSPWTNRPLRLSMDTQTPIGAGKMQADGDDLRVYRDETEIDRWLDSTSLNTTDTGIWINLNMPPLRTMVLGSTIGSTDPTPNINITWQSSTPMQQMNQTGRLLIDNEEFVYTSNNQVVGITPGSYANYFGTSERAARNTSAASHSAGATVTQIPYNLNIVYGNATATAPTVDDTLKPIINLTSTNGSFVWSTFRDVAGKRSGTWLPYVQKVSNPALSRSDVYTSTDDIQDVDPAVTMGTKICTFEQNGNWRADTATLFWRGFFPDGIASIALSGEKRQTDALWPSYKIQSAVTLPVWTSLYDLPATTTDLYGTWVALSLASSDFTIPAGSKYLRLLQNGTVSGDTDISAKVGIESMTIGLTSPPTVTTRAEQANYFVNFDLINDAGESVNIQGPMIAGTTLYIDTDPEYPTVTYNGQLANGMIAPNTTRARWLALQPSATAGLGYTNYLAAATDISIVVRWRNRLSFL
jgi:hypothetical protein